MKCYTNALMKSTVILENKIGKDAAFTLHPSPFTLHTSILKEHD